MDKKDGGAVKHQLKYCVGMLNSLASEKDVHTIAVILSDSEGNLSNMPEYVHLRKNSSYFGDECQCVPGGCGTFAPLPFDP